MPLFTPKSVLVGLVPAVVASALTFVAAVLPSGTPGAAPSAAAANCPDVQVVFARGRLESAGPGELGRAFINSLGSKVGGRSFGSYAVKYPADTEVDVGANDMSQHVQQMINNCPATRLVLGGYSLGACIAEFFRLQIKEECWKGLIEHTKDGWNIGPAPYTRGYCRCHDHEVGHPGSDVTFTLCGPEPTSAEPAG